MRTAPVGQRCLECAAPSDRQRVMDMDDVRRASDRPTPVTMAILVACIGIFVAEIVLGERFSDTVRQFAVQDNLAVAFGQWWRAITHAFLHARPNEGLGFTHILFNMYALYIFGPPLERDVGSVPFLMLYLASALGGGAAYYLLEPTGQSVGASGAIFGLFGAWLAASYRGRHTAAGRANLNQLLVLLAINAALGFTPGLSIAWQGHLGGLIAGFAIGMIWSAPRVRGTNAGRTVAAVAVGLVAIALLTLG